MAQRLRRRAGRGDRVAALIDAWDEGRAKVWHCPRDDSSVPDLRAVVSTLRRFGCDCDHCGTPRERLGAGFECPRSVPGAAGVPAAQNALASRGSLSAIAPRKNRLRGIPFAPNCAIVAADGAVLSVTGRSASECSALCRASTHRKENYGYCQESYKEAGREKARREEVRCEKTRREEARREESSGEKTRREEGCEETRCEAQTERRVHEGDDALGRCSLRSSARRRCRAPK